MNKEERIKRNQEEYIRHTGRELTLIDANTFQTKLRDLAVTLRYLVEREGQLRFNHLFMHADIAMMLKHVRTVYDLLFYLNADERIESDPTYDQAYSFSFLPLLRTMIDGFYNITAILDDPKRATLFRTSGYKHRLDAANRNAERYGTDQRWLRQAEDIARQISLDACGVPGLNCASGEERHWTRRAYGTWQEVPA